jgi:hypothetical protein
MWQAEFESGLTEHARPDNRKTAIDAAALTTFFSKPSRPDPNAIRSGYRIIFGPDVSTYSLRSDIMKKIFVCLAVAAGALAAPALSFAQSNGPVTRAEVRADLIRVEKAGYEPGRANDIYYPADIQAAEAKIAAQDKQTQAQDSVGGVALTGTSSSGKPSRSASNNACVGPVSYCNVYFGS